jgi:Tol biopolymer transport system component
MKTRSNLLVIFSCSLLLVSAACGQTPSQSASSTSSPMQEATVPPPVLQGDILAFTRFSTETGEGEGIYIIESDGIGLTKLASGPKMYTEHPSWSPDGTKIVYDTGGQDFMSYSIWSMNVDGSQKVQLTPPSMSGFMPAWSPDGKQIAFSGLTDRTQKPHIYIMDTDGTNLHAITKGDTVDLIPSWTPDGTLLFLRGVNSNYGDVFSMNTEGSNVVQLTHNGQLGGYALSPDGKSLAVNEGAQHRLVLQPVSGSGQPVTLVDAFSECPHLAVSWRPDGKSLSVGCSSWDMYAGGSNLYTVNADGTGLTKLENLGIMLDPAWKP